MVDFLSPAHPVQMTIDELLRLVNTTLRSHFVQHSNPRDVHSRALEDIVAQDICFALFVGCNGARSEIDGSVGACTTALGESAWVDAENRVDDL